MIIYMNRQRKWFRRFDFDSLLLILENGDITVIYVGAYNVFLSVFQKGKYFSISPL